MKRLLYTLTLMALTLLPGCGDIECDDDADCPNGEICADAGGVFFTSRVCVATGPVDPNNMVEDMGEDLGADMSTKMADGGADLGVAEDMQSDAQTMDMADPDMPCVPRSSQEICAANGAECGSPMVDECGATITINCGQCDPPDVCMDGDCVCEAETNEDFCSRFGADCGMVTNLDNCGDSRTVDCGACTGNEECGEQAPNVCGCPCDIGGTCYPDQAVNPSNPCEICDPRNSTSQWSVDAGKSCSDGDLCTNNDVCQSNGTCQGDAVVCTSGSSCRTASCDPGSGACIETNRSDGSACPGPGSSCISSTCQSGSCVTSLDSGSCLIGGNCYDSGDRNPTQECEWCDPSTNENDWSPATNQQCTNDGISCTLDICNSTGQCTHPLQPGYCRIGSTCHQDEDRNPMADCEWCDSSVSPTSWVNVPAGETCPGDGVTCTDDVCNGSGACEHPVQSNKCYINMTCYNAGQTSGFDCCRGCNPSQSQTFFTGVNDGMTCAFNCGSGPGSCMNGACTDGMQLCIPDSCPIE